MQIKTIEANKRTKPSIKENLEQGQRSIDIELEEFERHTPEGISSFNKSFTFGTLGDPESRWYFTTLFFQINLYFLQVEGNKFHCHSIE